MCTAIGGVAEMSRISNRVATVGAALAIVLLVILLVILWSDVRNMDRVVEPDAARIRKNSTVERVVNETWRKQQQVGLRVTTRLVSAFGQPPVEQNFTNEGESHTASI